MPEIGPSGLMSGDGKRSMATWLKQLRPSSTLLMAGFLGDGCSGKPRFTA